MSKTGSDVSDAYRPFIYYEHDIIVSFGGYVITTMLNIRVNLRRGDSGLMHQSGNVALRVSEKD
jgi:hypothetical protein